LPHRLEHAGGGADFVHPDAGEERFRFAIDAFLDGLAARGPRATRA
jgi:hypothetical protein